MAEHLRGDKELESIYRQDYAKRHDLTDLPVLRDGNENRWVR